MKSPSTLTVKIVAHFDQEAWQCWKDGLDDSSAIDESLVLGAVERSVKLEVSSVATGDDTDKPEEAAR